MKEKKSLCAAKPLLSADGTVRWVFSSITSNVTPSYFLTMWNTLLFNTTALSTLRRANRGQQTFLMINIHFLQHPITAQCTYWMDGLALFNWYFHLRIPLILQQMRQNRIIVLRKCLNFNERCTLFFPEYSYCEKIVYTFLTPSKQAQRNHFQHELFNNRMC